MPFSAESAKPPLHNQITEMQRKIQLLEGDKTAYYESSQATISKNKERILQLRQENKRLYRKAADANASDEHIVKGAFNNRGTEKDAYRNMSVKEAQTTIDSRVLSKIKRLNALKHNTNTYRQRLKELNMKYERMKAERSGGGSSADARTRKKEEDAMTLRALENRLGKTQFKCQEAENVMTNYLKLKSHLQEESLTFQGQLDNLEAEILKHTDELRKLQVMKNDAQLAKDAAKTELQQQEELLYKERKERETIIAGYRKKVEARKAQADKADRRQIQRMTTQPDELSSEPQHSTARMAGGEDSVISTFEEAFQRIKEATGVTDIHEVVERFMSQKDKHQRLEKLKVENETVLQQRKEQKEFLTQELQNMKYSGEAKLSSGQQLMDEKEQHLQAQRQRCDEAKEHVDGLVKTLSTVRAGVEHLADKLQHIALSDDKVAAVSADSDEYVVGLLTQCGLKLQLLYEGLQGKDLAAVMKEMEEEEFFIRIEGKLPPYNTRVKISEVQRLDLFDEDESDEDDEDIISREALKCQSQMLTESKSKKKPWKKKKGKF